MSEPLVVGLQPKLPGSLGSSIWWSRPVPAERLIALRIGVALVLLVDVLLTYWSRIGDFFGPGSLGSAEVFADRRSWPHLNWSILPATGSSGFFQVMCLVWAVSALMLLVGLLSRPSALVAWLLSVSVINLDYFIHNAGDRVRTFALFYLMLSPCGAVWSLDHFFRRRQIGTLGPILIHPWPLRLIFLQMTVIYFFSGIFKLMGPQWRAGVSLYYVMGDIAWSRWSFAQLPLPFVVTQGLTWLVLVWELCFPLLVLSPLTRRPTLWLGVFFHLGNGLSLELGFFPFYMLCLYLPLLPWERWLGRGGHLLSSPNRLAVEQNERVSRGSA